MKQEKLWGGILIALALLFLILMTAGNRMTASLKDEDQSQQETISRLEEKLEDGASVPSKPATELTETEQETALASAAEAGQQVADCQNAYLTLDSSSDRDAYLKNVEAMDALLTEDGKSARVRWYSSELPGQWTFETDGTFEGNTLGVLWLCRNPEDGSLTAYATGTYHVDSGQFSSIACRLTSQAERAIAATGDGDQENPTVDDLPIDQINNADTDDVRDLTEEEIESVKEAQQKLREQNQ